MSPSSSNRTSSNGIDKLDYRPAASPRRPLLHPDPESDSNRPSQDNSYAGSFFEQVAEGIMERDRERLQRQFVRWLSFVWAVVNCLCAGSITAYSLYGHLFQSRLHYTQFQVNIVSICAELGMYLPVSVFGYLCDRLGPGVPSFLSGIMFGLGYALAAFAYHSGPPPSAGGHGWAFGVMVLAFVGVGMGTSCMYLSAVTTCAKNFGRGNAKGIALAVPIAAFGLSGMWQSQVGSRLLFERNPDGGRGDVDVFRYFLFLAITLLCVGIIGAFTLRIVDEEGLIDDAVEELERSGLLAQNEFFSRAASIHGYGTMETRDLSDSTFDFLQTEADRLKQHAEEEARKKTWLLNEETRRYLTDSSMWWLAAGFFLVTGPGEAFINNLGTVIGTLSPPHTASRTSPATHVSIVAITSTVARLITGTLSDILAPVALAYQHHRGPESVDNSLASLPPRPRKFTVSRIIFLLTFAFILSLGQLLLASGVIQNHASRFAAVSTLIGAGYGAVFSLTPIVVSVVWGVENFGTNWGILAMTPAAGATLWGAIYAAVYQRAAGTNKPGVERDPNDVLCYGSKCYAPTFWAMAVSVWVACGLWIWAWRGPVGWKRRGIVV
ncbi:MFS monocarboxylic acid transporter-like protein [Lindgomyces ingoldianus]|uniref:MFS monocarboxylic acid transporter-like protein n=1 Tax=Lindgomyces ingoldianus TaxID=673940 RepID=A0ACB6Q8X4_9PLEO|nr:MFS monocarboxylic acid transporter-like protein [Lindgomyces ingoldianus]KAF2463337.1 MFS monocarboxylic acid transporter-like protein [Lindgomyces ingoldianus]